MLPGAMMPPHDDSMVAKLIAHGDTRAEAIALMARALRVMVQEGGGDECAPALRDHG